MNLTVKGKYNRDPGWTWEVLHGGYEIETRGINIREQRKRCLELGGISAISWKFSVIEIPWNL